MTRGRRAAPVLMLLGTLVLGACSGASDSPGSADADAGPAPLPSAPSSTPPTTPPAVASCEGLADRWVEIQQSFLDDLGDAPVADSGSSPRIIEAGRRMGLLLLEHGRDIERAGCLEQLAPGSALQCEHLAELQPGGPAGADVVEGLGADCP